MKARTFIVILFTLIFVMCVVGGIADNYDWPRWRGPNGDGISMETDWNPEALAAGLKIVWEVEIGMGYSNVAIKDKYLYTMGYKSRKVTVYCYKAANGKEVWRFDYPVKSGGGYGPLATPTIDGKNVYTLGHLGIMHCLNAKNGKVRWKKDLVSEYDIVIPYYRFSGSPVIEGDLVILNLNLAGVALDKKTGEKVWISEKYHPTKQCRETKNQAGYATPIIYDYDGKRYALMYNCTGLYSVDIQTGDHLWYYEWFNFEYADPIIFENKVFISTGYSDASCLLLEMKENGPKVLWQNGNMKNYFSSSVLVDGYLYGIDGELNKLNTLRCIEWETGHLMWEKNTKMGSLIAADGKLIILEEDGDLHIALASPSSYKEISSVNVFEGKQIRGQFWTPPVLYKSKIYSRSIQGELVCIDVSR